MPHDSLDRLMKQADALSADEKLRLAGYLVEQVHRACQQDTVRPKWSDACSIGAPSLYGEDAQAWVSRMRREADERRKA